MILQFPISRQMKRRLEKVKRAKHDKWWREQIVRYEDEPAQYSAYEKDNVS